MIDEFKPILKNSKFLYLWFSEIFSLITINIMNFVFLIRLFTVTGSTVATSLLWVAYALPAILIGPFAAASVDMVGKRKMLMVTNLLQAATVFSYALIHQTRFYLLYGVVLTYSFLNQFYGPAELASLPSLVPKKFLPQANSIYFLSQQAALILGFGIAGVFNHLLGFRTTLMLCSFLLFLAFVSVSFLPEMEAGESLPEGIEEGIMTFFKRILEGYNFIKENTSILLPFILLMGLQVALAILAVNIPPFAKEIFRININLGGVLIVVPAGLGALIGAFLISRLVKAGWRKKRIIDISLMITTLSLFLLAFLVPELTGGAKLIGGILIILIAGAAYMGIMVPSQTFLQEATPGGLRGRVFGNFWFLVTIATLLPVIFSGAITELFGVRLLLFVLAGVTLAGFIFSRKFGQKILENKGLVKSNDKKP